MCNVKQAGYLFNCIPERTISLNENKASIVFILRYCNIYFICHRSE